VGLSLPPSVYKRLSELNLTVPGWNEASQRIETRFANIQQMERILKLQ
jgi:hypothetical protein